MYNFTKLWLIKKVAFTIDWFWRILLYYFFRLIYLCTIWVFLMLLISVKIYNTQSFIWLFVSFQFYVMLSFWCCRNTIVFDFIEQFNQKMELLCIPEAFSDTIKSSILLNTLILSKYPFFPVSIASSVCSIVYGSKIFSKLWLQNRLWIFHEAQNVAGWNHYFLILSNS